MTQQLQKIKFIVASRPIAQPRQQHRIVTPKGRKPFVSNYVPADHPVHHYKTQVRLCASQEIRGRKFTGPVLVNVRFVMPRPKNKTWKTKPMPRYSHVGKPDTDNLLKSTFDALNEIAWDDDSQVCEVIALKVVASGDEVPHVEIEITEFVLSVEHERSSLCLPF